MERNSGGRKQSGSHKQGNERRDQRFLIGPFIFNINLARLEGRST